MQKSLNSLYTALTRCANIATNGPDIFDKYTPITMMRGLCITALTSTMMMIGALPSTALAESTFTTDQLSHIADLREGDMRKLAIHDSVKPLANPSLLDGNENSVSLADYRGKWVVLNFWATWCAPCRKEMPSLDRLQQALPHIAVLPVATGRNPLPGIQKFYDEAGLKNLPILRDPKSELARSAHVMALPVTVILTPDGTEIARLIGDAEWDSASAIAIMNALANPNTSQAE